MATYTLLNAEGRPYRSPARGRWGGHRGSKIYGRLDCPSALRAIARGGYVRQRVFFADEATAVAAGFRPCANCCRDRYQKWQTGTVSDRCVTLTGMTLTTRMLTPETWDDFAALVEANNGVWGGCWCIGFHPEGVGHGREGNRDLKHQHVVRGTVHQVLVYDGERCVGWCQFGPPAEVATINNAKAYEKDLTELPDWRIGCIFTHSKDRGKGIAAAAVAAALEEIRRAGGGVVEAYPEQTQERPPQRGAYLHTGPEELYTRYGFTRVRKIAKWRWVMRTEI